MNHTLRNSVIRYSEARSGFRRRLQLIALACCSSTLLMLMLYAYLFDSNNDSKETNGKKSPESNKYFYVLLLVLFVSLSVVNIIRQIYLRLLGQMEAEGNSASHNVEYLEAQSIGRLLRMNSRDMLGPRGISRLHLALMRRQRDFTGDDYEMLQQLDEGVTTGKPKGATEGELLRFPTHTLTARDVESSHAESKECSICLEPFEQGEVVKIIPCLHRFHQNCIDTWLRSQAICPVCKFSAVE
mmetsp:Transcript_6143/g.9265  ORF Transcript_6143/g.9265 Transcript_6143/m.9265 type:complete len:242 (-) Transcript_6143:194-919(-)